MEILPFLFGKGSTTAKKFHFLFSSNFVYAILHLTNLRKKGAHREKIIHSCPCRSSGF